MALDEGDGGGEFVDVGGAHDFGEEGGGDVRGCDEVGRHEGGGVKVGDGHHLRGGDAAIAGRGGEDVVLGGVCETVEEEVDGE